MSADPPRSASPISSDIGAEAFVQASALCKGLPQEALGVLMRAGLVVEHGPGAVIFHQGSDDQGLFVILEGRVSIQKEHEGRMVELALLERSGIIGESAALTEQPRKITAITQTDTRLAFFPGSLVRRAAELAPKFGRRLAALMAGRDKDMDKKLGDAQG